MTLPTRWPLLTVVLAVTALALTGPAAVAGERRVGLSDDGRTWGASLRTPVVAHTGRWVPGESGRGSFYVRNDAPTAARLTVRVVARGGEPVPSDLRLRARVAGTRWHPVGARGPSTTLTRSVLATDGVARVDLAVDLPWSASNDSQRSVVPLEFAVRLTQAEPGTGGHTRGLLPGTGSTVPPWLLWLTAVALGAGPALLGAGSRGVRE